MTLTLIVSIIALGVLVLVHEVGHFLLARACGMRVDTFSVGFGPALLSWRGKGTEYRISLLPLGGYVRIAGMAPGDGTPAEDPRSFMNRPAWQRFLVILAGPMVNWILAVVLLAGLFTVGHRVPTGEPVVEEVSGAPAAAAGLMPGDRVIAVNGRPVANWDELRAAVGARRGQPIELRVQRRGGELTLTARPGPDGRLGITAESRLERYRVAQAIPLAFETSGRILADTLVGLGQLFRGGGKVELLGPIGIVSETAEAASLGLTYLFGILVQISMVLALMNLLPLPALDGGRLAFICVAMIRRRPVSPKIEAVVHGVGLILLLGLLLFATYGDIGRQLTRSREPDAGVPAAQPMETP